LWKEKDIGLQNSCKTSKYTPSLNPSSTKTSMVAMSGKNNHMVDFLHACRGVADFLKRVEESVAMFDKVMPQMPVLFRSLIPSSPVDPPVEYLVAIAGFPISHLFSAGRGLIPVKS
jgi:hypothetical protein